MSTTASKVPETKAATQLAALGNTTRLRLYRLLVKAGDEGLNIGQIQDQLAVPASTLAHHLTTLARAGLIEQERRGREVICRTNYPAMTSLVTFLTEACCSGIALTVDTDAA